MAKAFYLDPVKKYVPMDVSEHVFDIGFWRLLDCSEQDLKNLPWSDYPQAHYMMAEIHSWQLEKLPCRFDRLSIVQTKLQPIAIGNVPLDITFHWDNRYVLQSYFDYLDVLIKDGVQHFSFYGVSQFEQWQKLADFLKGFDIAFYDRFHASKKGFESPYQKHIAAYGSLCAWGGWSRVTDEDNVTRVKKPNSKNWQILSAEDQIIERLMFAMADRSGVRIADWQDALDIDAACKAGLAQIDGDRLCPTDRGIWDNIGLVSSLLCE